MRRKQVTAEQAEVLEHLGYTIQHYYDPSEAPRRRSVGKKTVNHRAPSRSRTIVLLGTRKLVKSGSTPRQWQVYQAARTALRGQSEIKRHVLVGLIVRETGLQTNQVQPQLSMLKDNQALRFRRV